MSAETETTINNAIHCAEVVRDPLDVLNAVFMKEKMQQSKK